ncbi:MAG: penicillin-binding protein [Flavobacterium sp.]|nr:penicillin-binding protein [Flavobacterium sp.]
MAVEVKHSAVRIFLVSFAMIAVAGAVIFHLTKIQWTQGAHYRKLASQNTVKVFEIKANKGNIYSADGSLLATTVPNYNFRFDAMAASTEDFNEFIAPLCDSLHRIINKPAAEFETNLRKARAQKNRYFLIARNLSHKQFRRIKKLPLSNGFNITAENLRKHPMGRIAERTIGYVRKKPDSTLEGKGVEFAFRRYLDGKDGKVLKQKIAQNQWKPIRDVNEVEPHDGYDVISTIDVYIQDIAHHALLKQLKEYEADHGCVVVMETKTGYIRAIANLAKATDGSYYEANNYAIMEAHEPGSTYKLADLVALLEDQKVDTTAIFDTKGGRIQYGDGWVVDSHPKAQKMTLALGFENSLNTVMVQAVHNNYKNNPSAFVKHLENFGLTKPIGIAIQGEGIPTVPVPGSKNWNNLSLPWMAFGYGVHITPLQTLTFYNAVANNGEMVKPQFVSEIKEYNKTIKRFPKQVMNPSICSPTTLIKVKAILKNVVKFGTAKDLYSKEFSMAGKTGTAQANYAPNGGADKYYISSFVGYFPAEAPKYSCIVVVHKPKTTSNNYYGADVAGPVFKRVAQKIFTDAPTTNEISNINRTISKQDAQFNAYYKKVQDPNNILPNLKGMAGMDAVALLENWGLKVKVNGIGKVKSQSISAGTQVKKNTLVTLQLF